MSRIPRPFRLLALGLVVTTLSVLPSAAAEEGNEPSPAPAAVVGAAEQRTGGRPHFGLAVQPRGGQTYAEALAVADRRYGKLKVIRYFDPSVPNPWPQLRDLVGRRPLVVSFKMDPVDVIDGDHDRLMRTWFRRAPENRTTWWTFAPEPEDVVAAGEYTARQYRRAWARLSTFADRAENPRLRATLALMCWTLNPDSGRSWRDYYPGDRHIDVLSWDCYNWAASRGYYAHPRTSFRKAVRLSDRVGKDWGIAETGSVLVGGDEGRDRATWLRQLRRFSIRHGASFATYFDVESPAADYRLGDRHSRRAWRRAVSPGL